MKGCCGAGETNTQRIGRYTMRIKWHYIVIVLIFLGYYFRAEVANHYGIYFHTSEDIAAWVGDERKSVYDGLEHLTLQEAIAALSAFEEKIRNELRRLPANEEPADTQQRDRYTASLICELAVIYKKKAMKSLEAGREVDYVAYIQKSRAELERCANVRHALPE